MFSFYSLYHSVHAALKRLLQDVEAGKINVIVVYKVDPLTRGEDRNHQIATQLVWRGCVPPQLEMEKAFVRLR